LDADRLNQHRLEALAPIRHRYIEELHVETPAESIIRAALPDSGLSEVLANLRRSVEGARSEVSKAETEDILNREPRENMAAIHDALEHAEGGLRVLQDLVGSGELPEAGAVLAMLPDQDADDRLEDAIESERIEPGRGLPRDITHAQRILNGVWRFEKGLAERLATPLLGAVGRAGAGKTHLAASISGPADSARGVLLLGLDFGAEIADDDLGRFSRLSQHRDELLEAMEAVGVREGRRVPLVIDGLNEADEPTKWKAPLARLAAKLSTLPHVVGIVTVRPRFVELTLPDGTQTREIPGLLGVEEEAVERYFAYYKIEADHRALHWWRPSDALLLSIFCRTVNPERVATVSAADLPGSLHEVFDAHLEGVFRRIAVVMEIDEADVRRATLQLAYLSLEAGTRGLERAEVSRALGDEERAPHRKSLRFQLENEEIISREVTDAGAEEVFWAYDLLAGHLIASSILERHDDRREIGGPDLSSTIAAHPLVEDVVAGLSGMLANEDIELVGLMGGHADLLGDAALASVRLGG